MSRTVIMAGERSEYPVMGGGPSTHSRPAYPVHESVDHHLHFHKCQQRSGAVVFARSEGKDVGAGCELAKRAVCEAVQLELLGVVEVRFIPVG